MVPLAVQLPGSNRFDAFNFQAMDSKRCSCSQHPGCQGLRFFGCSLFSHHSWRILSNLSIKDREILTAATAEILLMDDESLWGVLLRLHQHDVCFLSAHPRNPLLQKLHAEYVYYVCFGLRNTISLQTQKFCSSCGIQFHRKISRIKRAFVSVTDGATKGIETYEVASGLKS